MKTCTLCKKCKHTTKLNPDYRLIDLWYCSEQKKDINSASVICEKFDSIYNCK